MEATAVEFNLQDNELEFTTRAALKSDAEFILTFLTDSSADLGFLKLKFYERVMYELDGCTTSETPILFPTEPSENVLKTWKVTKTTTTLKLTCEGEVLLDLTYATDCTVVGGDSGYVDYASDVTHIKFAGATTAYYRPVLGKFSTRVQSYIYPLQPNNIKPS